jgi:hypothetical protein
MSQCTKGRKATEKVAPTVGLFLFPTFTSHFGIYLGSGCSCLDISVIEILLVGASTSMEEIAVFYVKYY